MAKGIKTGGGSRKGRPNKATAQREAEIAASGLTPLDFMLSVMRDESRETVERLDAAKAAAPYVHPKLAAQTMNINTGQGLEDWLASFPPYEAGLKTLETTRAQTPELRAGPSWRERLTGTPK